MMREEQKRIEHQSMIERMDREELELIQRLQVREGDHSYNNNKNEF
jgi:hypothetical protein